MEQLPTAKKSDAIAARTQLRAKLIESLQEKLIFWTHIPWKILGVFYCEVAPDALELCKGQLRECIELYDSLLASGRVSSLHRVARLLLDPDRVCGQELRAFLASDLRLREYPTAYAMLRTYCLVSLVERRIESVHAILKRL